MNKDSEKTKEQTKRKSETNNQEHDRNSVKKSTLSLSEIPNIIKEELNTELNPKKSISQIFLEEKGLLYPNKLKKSFIFDRIKTPKDETPSSLAEVKKLLEIENKEKNEKNEKNEKKNKSITQNNKEQFSQAITQLKTNLDNVTYDNYNTIIMARNQEIEKWKQQERLRAEQEKQQFSQLIHKYDQSLTMGEMENQKLKMRLKELQGYFG